MKKVFDKVLIVMFENQYRSYVMQDPYMKKLAAAGCNLTNYFGAFHPSQTNYLASLAGEVCATTNDIPPAQPLMQETLTNLMQPGDGSAKVSWKAYMEAYPGQPWNKDWVNPTYPESEQPIPQYPNDGINLARYFRKHNAFASYHDIQSVEDKWNKIVDEFTFWKDVKGGNLPEYSWFTPDIWNDGHYVYNTHISTDPRIPLVGQLSAWLEYVFFNDIETTKVQGGTLFGTDKIGFNLDLDLVMTDPKKAYANSNIPEGTLVVVTWDEADYDAKGYDTNYDGQNQIYTVLLGDMIEPGTAIDTPYNHYSLMKTIEQNFGLGSLNKNDKAANWFRFMWDEKYVWTESKETDLTSASNVASAYFNDAFYLVTQDNSNQLNWSKLEGGKWSTPTALGFSSNDQFVLDTTGDELMLVFTDENDDLFYSTFSAGESWSEKKSIEQSNVAQLAMTSYFDYADGQNKLMLAWKDGLTDYMYSLIYSNGSWSTDVMAVGQLTDGSIAASSLGGSVYLVYKERNTFSMRMTSFNTAPFNAFEAKDFKGNPDKDNDTALHTWSPMDFEVGHFSKKQNQHQEEYLANGNLAMAAIEGEIHLSYRAKYEDTPYIYSTVFGLTGIMTASNENTNGFGTLNQAGWTREVPNNSIQLDPTSTHIMASNGEQILQVYQASGSDKLTYRIGGYQKLLLMQVNKKNKNQNWFKRFIQNKKSRLIESAFAIIIK